MFKFFKSRGQTASPQHVSQNTIKADVNDEDEIASNVSTLDLLAEIGGGKGWPTDATCVLYHKTEVAIIIVYSLISQGLLCVGTESGAIFVYGDGFQFMRPWLTEHPNEVMNMVAMCDDKILVAFGDNSIVAMTLPNLDVIDLLKPTWLPRSFGGISSINVDLPSQKDFAYIGTSEGFVQVLDVNMPENGIRVCEFSLSPADVGVGHYYAVSDVLVCPKDEKYLAIGYDGPDAQDGYVVIFDLVKNKVHRSQKTAAITTMIWHHNGEVLYAGTRTGDLLAIGLEKQFCNTLWNAAAELNDDADEEENRFIYVRRINWLPPQAHSPDGCLFVSLASSGTNNDNLKSIVVGLSPNSHGIPLCLLTWSFLEGEMRLVLSLPPIPYEKLIGFRVVPMFDRSAIPEESAETLANPAASGTMINPALLLLTQRPLDDDPSHVARQLKVLACPPVPISEWALEIGTLPDPRVATEVLPSTSSITCMQGYSPSKVSWALSHVFIKQLDAINGKIVASPKPCEDVSEITALEPQSSADAPIKKVDARASKRLSTRDFLQTNNLISDLEMQLDDPWTMVLASGVQELQKNEDSADVRHQDIVLKGHANGTVIAWGVSLPENRQDLGRGNIWLPFKALRCGSAAITAIAQSEKYGILAAGDESGQVVLWEVFNSDTAFGIIDLLKLRCKHTNENAANYISSQQTTSQSPHHELDEDSEIFNGLEPDNLREAMRISTRDRVSAILLLPEFVTMFVGTEDGSVYCCNDWGGQGSTKPLPKVEKFSGVGAVLSIQLHYYASQDAGVIPAIYVWYAGTQLVVYNFLTLTPVATSLGVAADKQDSSSAVIDCNLEMCFTNLINEVIAPPHVRDVSRLIASSRRMDFGDVSHGGDHGPEVSLPPAQKSASRISLFSRTSNKNINNTPPPAPDPSPKSAGAGGYHVETSSIPHFLYVVHGRQLVQYDIKKFSAVAQKKGFAQVVSNIISVTSKTISKQPIIAAKMLTFKDRAEGDLSYYFGCITKEGLFVLVSIRHKAPVNHTSILDGVVQEGEVAIDSGLVVSNGHCYLNRGGSMIYTASVRAGAHDLAHALPDRAQPMSTRPHISWFLLHGREQMIEQLKATLKKRRQSMINISSGPTDLYKLFSKTRSQSQQKDSLVDGARDESDADLTPTRKVNRDAQQLTSDMEQIKIEFHKRGEALNRIEQKMNDFKQTAQEYRQTVAQQKQQLQQKNARWGLF